ncbi:UNVERIFIED_CONTAM: hypothetical protein FKN15_037272 [Acipenser sinensis]
MPVFENEGISDTRSRINTGGDFVVQRRREGQFGLPRISVSRHQLQIFVSRGYTGKRIAEHLGCSVSYIYKRLKAEGLSPRDKYSNITDNELDTEVKSLHSQYPNAGAEKRLVELNLMGYKPTGCSCGNACGSWDIRNDQTCHCQCANQDWTAARCCKIAVK